MIWIPFQANEGIGSTLAVFDAPASLRSAIRADSRIKCV
jgi:hypothetical protein